MVDVLNMPEESFGYVPTPALVAPVEFTLRREDYEILGGHMAEIRPVDDVVTPEIRKVAPEAGWRGPDLSRRNGGARLRRASANGRHARSDDAGRGEGSTCGRGPSTW